jgi:hypothetical protein
MMWSRRTVPEVGIKTTAVCAEDREVKKLLETGRNIAAMFAT